LDKPLHQFQMNLYRSKEGEEESKKKGTRKKEENEVFTKAIGSS